MIKIFNEHLTVKISNLGAEVKEVTDNLSEHNYMYEQDDSVWASTAPVLFPVVGKCTNNEIRYKGKKYDFKSNHGFARISDFEHIKHSNSEVEMILNSSMMDEDSFPFEFEFCVTYKLEGRSLYTTYSVTNTSAVPIYFSVGAHPAFKCPFDDKHKLSDYYLEFDESEDILTKHEITPDAFFTGKTSAFKTDKGIIDLAEHNIADTFVFSNFKSECVSLVEKNSDRAITVSLNGFPYIAFWKKPNGDFVCIEPWCGKADDVGFTGDIDQKKDIIKLEPYKEDFEVTYVTDFDYEV
ncbi:MAG: aldose 1-epimerase family protein [Fusobacteriaceae bacterium]